MSVICMDKIFAGGIMLFCLLVAFSFAAYYSEIGIVNNIDSFEDCVAAGYPVMESYPRQCSVPGIGTFTEDISIEITQALCSSSGGHWNECSNKCHLDNQGKIGAACTMQCEALCECAGIAGFSCPSGYYCKLPNDPDLRDALGYCEPVQRMPPIDNNMAESIVCEAPNGAFMSLKAALEIAGSGTCSQKGSLTDRHYCNEGTETWWIDMEPYTPVSGCNPACVVNVKTGESEVNWRCTGLIQ